MRSSSLKSQFDFGLSQASKAKSINEESTATRQVKRSLQLRQSLEFKRSRRPKHFSFERYKDFGPLLSICRQYVFLEATIIQLGRDVTIPYPTQIQ